MLNLYFISMLLAALLGWAAWAVVLYKLSPFTSPLWALGLFYASLFVALMATTSCIIYAVRRFFSHPARYSNDIQISLRQGSLFSFLVCLAAMFQRMRVLSWWNILLLVLILVVLEFYLSRRPQ